MPNVTSVSEGDKLQTEGNDEKVKSSKTKTKLGKRVQYALKHPIYQQLHFYWHVNENSIDAERKWTNISFQMICPFSLQNS